VASSVIVSNKIKPNLAHNSVIHSWGLTQGKQKYIFTGEKEEGRRGRGEGKEGRGEGREGGWKRKQSAMSVYNSFILITKN
jgi:hypothetical protein